MLQRNFAVNATIKSSKSINVRPEFVCFCLEGPVQVQKVRNLKQK